MANSLSRLTLGAEGCPVEEWRKFAQLSEARKLSSAQLLRDPLKNVVFRDQHIAAVFGYLLEDGKAHLVYFWDKELRGLSWRNVDTECVHSSLLRFGSSLGRLHDHNPSLIRALDFMDEGGLTPDAQFREKFDDHNLYWLRFDDLKFACLYKNRGLANPTTQLSSLGVQECLEFHNDFFRLRSPVWKAIPIRFLLNAQERDHESVRRMLLHPRCFNPEEETPQDSFLWPWQYCICLEAAGRISYRAKATTSLVFDLRKSTIALEQLNSRDIAEFSPFIKSIVEMAKSAVAAHGGFFDKDTGDGIVAHFVDFDADATRVAFESAAKRAFDAGVQIIKQASVICNAFQAKLRLGVGGLGGSVGIHTGSAVWLVDDGQVRAIGDSAILASRLCGEAPQQGIFLSNSEFLSLSDQLAPDIVPKFARRPYSGKEVTSGAELFGYAIEVRDFSSGKSK